MKNSKDDIREIEALEDDIETLKGLLSARTKRLVEKHHPLKKGDVVTVNGYSYVGKKMVVEGRNINKYCGRYRWTALGFILKKDGSASLKTGKWFQEINLDE